MLGIKIKNYWIGHISHIIKNIFDANGDDYCTHCVRETEEKSYWGKMERLFGIFGNRQYWGQP